MTRRGRFTPGTAIGLVLVLAGLVILAVAVVRGRAPAANDVYTPPPPPVPPDASSVEPIVAHRIGALTDAVIGEPASAAAWARLGGVYLVHDLLDPAVACLDVASRLDPADFRWPYLLGLATGTGDRSTAITHYRRAIELQPAYPPVQIHLGQALLDAGVTDEARARFGAALASAPASVAAHLGLAEVALAGGETQAARGHLEEAQRCGPRSGRILSLRAELDRRAGDIAAAERNLRAAARRRPDEPIVDPVREAWVWNEGVAFRWRLTRSVSYARAGQIERALDAWRELLAFDPDAAVAHEQMGKLLAGAGRNAAAVDAYRAALAIDGDLPEARARLGALLAREEDSVEEGLAMIRAASAAGADDQTINGILAATLRDLGRFDAALAVTAARERAYPDDLSLVLERGVTLRRAGRADEAVVAFRAILADDPVWPGARNHLAHALWAAGEYADAIAALREVQAETPDDAQVKSDLAWMLATSPEPGTRDGAEARSLVEPLCAQAGFANPVLLRNLAAACAEMGDFPAAAQHAQRALSLIDAEAPEAWHGLVPGLQEQLRTYGAGLPYRDTTPPD